MSIPDLFPSIADKSADVMIFGATHTMEREVYVVRLLCPRVFVSFGRIVFFSKTWWIHDISIDTIPSSPWKKKHCDARNHFCT